MVRKLIPIMLASLLLTGYGSFWEDQGEAARTRAAAQAAQAEAAKQNAEAAIIDAQSRGALAASQADALHASTNALVDLADDGEYVWLFAGLALAILAFAGWAIWATHRRPAATPPAEARRQYIMLETPVGCVRMIREPQETPEQFTIRVAMLAAALGTEEARMLAPPTRR